MRLGVASPFESQGHTPDYDLLSGRAAARGPIEQFMLTGLLGGFRDLFLEERTSICSEAVAPEELSLRVPSKPT